MYNFIVAVNVLNRVRSLEQRNLFEQVIYKQEEEWL